MSRAALGFNEGQREGAAMTVSFATYFAYGANMSGPILGARLGRTEETGFARRLGILQDHRLAFAKVSSTDPLIGYATVVPAPGCSIQGVLNSLTRDELARLDAIELVPVHYTRCVMQVHDPAAGTEVEANVYIAVASMCRPGLHPTRAYLDRLLGGADVLSPHYVAELASHPCR